MMGKIFLSKSKYCECVQCEKILWLNKHKPIKVDGPDKSTFEEGRKVGDFAKGLFGDYVDVPYDEDICVRVEKTANLLKNKPNVIAEASFIYDNNFCSVDVLKNDANGVEIYEVKSSTKVKDIHVDDIAYQYFILSNLGLNVKKACVVHINNKYVRGNELEIDKLFNIENCTEDAMQKQDEIRNNIVFINDFMKEHGENNEPYKQLGEYCFKPYDCDFWDYCTRDLPKPNVFDLKNMQIRTKLKNYNNGIVSFEDLERENLNQKCMEQIDFELNDNDPKIEREVIRDILDSLEYPLYFIDYEACRYAIPEYEGTKPYQQIPFQYSLHIIREEGTPLEHREFLAEAGDENIVRTFAESMINDLSEDGSVIVFNRIFEESLVNKRIGEMYPDLKNEIERINGNIVDFMEPFKNRNYYVREMKGSYSIKYVLPALYPNDPELNYGNLPLIHHGEEASHAFLNLKNESTEDQKEIREGLLKYCKLDTYAMVKIWEKFKEITDYD